MTPHRLLPRPLCDWFQMPALSLHTVMFAAEPSGAQQAAHLGGTLGAPQGYGERDPGTQGRVRRSPAAFSDVERAWALLVFAGAPRGNVRLRLQQDRRGWAGWGGGPTQAVPPALCGSVTRALVGR